MFTFELSKILEKKIKKLFKKDKKLAINFKRKIREIISRDLESIDTYKNLRYSQKNQKRIHLSDEFVLLFEVNKNEENIIFVDILHRDIVYKNK